MKNIRITNKAYDYLAKNVIYPDSMAKTLERLLGLPSSITKEMKK